MIPALSKTEKTKLAAIILGEISPSAVLFIILSRPQSTKELIALLGPFIPGDTLREKIAYAFTVTRPAFDSDARFREVAEGVLDKLRGVTDDEGETVEWDKYEKPEIEKPDQPSQPQDDDAVPFGNLRWNRGGENFAGAQRDSRVTIRNVNVTGTTLTYTGVGLTVWPIQTDNITHIWAIFFDDNRDGIYERGGKFDWGRSTAAPRPLHHVNHGYSNWDGYPKSGTPWAAVITDKTGRHRSNVVKGVWQ